MAKAPHTKPVAKQSAVRPASADLLLEIGTEELPYQFIAAALRTMADSAERLWKEHRLTYGRLRTVGTPRRLTLAVESLADRQAATVKETMGPSKAVAFDPTGQPTKAAIGFAGSQGVAVEDLEIRQTPKGEYVCAVKREPGEPARTVLPRILSELIAGLSFPKTMRWNRTGVRFARPIRWLLALHGRTVINLEIGGVRAGNQTWGHRFLGPPGRKAAGRVPVKDLKTYLKTLERCGVIADPEQRRKMILAQLSSLSKAAGGRLHRDEELLEQAVHTVEYPQALLGSFNPKYLTLPKAVLMTAMKVHQGYFSLMRSEGTLLPKFVAVTNMKLRNMRVIREGNERVLAARLADARFFFDEDRKIKLGDRVEKLKQVTFHQKLGSLHRKTSRMMQLAERLARDLGGSAELVNTCRRAAELSKADLLTGMVGEFPTLQGHMGGEYARHDGEPEAVCQAIAEQYLPGSMEGELPRSLPGKVLSLADRLDTLSAFFLVGLVPSGSEDPFALRRHAAAIVRLLVEGDLQLNLGLAVEQACKVLRDAGLQVPSSEEGGTHRIAEFLFERLRYYGRSIQGLRDDVMEAVLKPTPRSTFDVVDLVARMKALQAIAARPEFDPLMVGFKRAHRLVEKEQWSRAGVNPAVFQHPAEGELHKELQEAARVVPASLSQGEYARALEALVLMKPAIDEFFVSVMVNTDDQALRANRLSLLYGVDQVFMSFADFSQIAVQG
jgi:glycyl-tRNA synthetase beta chain